MSVMRANGPMRDRLRPAGADAVGALFVFLELLEGETEMLAEGLRADVDLDALHPDAASDVHIESCVTPTQLPAVRLPVPACYLRPQLVEAARCAWLIAPTRYRLTELAGLLSPSKNCRE